MKNLPRITEIIKIEPFKISCRWTTGEIRVIDFEPEFINWQKKGKSFLQPLQNYDKFENVLVKDGTLQWYSIGIEFTDLKGEQQIQPLDLDPDVLYQKSNSISLYKLIMNKSVVEQKQAIV